MSQHNLLNEAILKSGLQEVPCSIEVLDYVTSTNDYLKTSTAYFLPNSMHFCLAECQTSGRGRLARSWHSPYAENIYLSARMTSKLQQNELGALSLVMGLLVTRVIQECVPRLSPQVKWPNDVLVDGEKIAGVLLELHKNTEIIIGMGLNVHMAPSLPSVSQPYTSLYAKTRHHFDRNTIAICLMKALWEDCQLFFQSGFLPFMKAYERLDYLSQKEVTLQVGERQVLGMARGVDVFGRLLLETKEGDVRAFASGEARIVMHI